MMSEKDRPNYYSHLYQFEPAAPRATLDVRFLRQLGARDEHLPLLFMLNTPPKIQSFINKLRYNHDDGNETTRAIPGVLEAGEAHCFEGGPGFAYPLLSLWLYYPEIVMLQADNDRDIDHNIVVYRIGDKLGAVAQSSFPKLKSRPPIFNSLRDLVMSYYPYYLDKSDSPDKPTLRGYTDPIDLTKWGTDCFFKPGDFAMKDIYDHYTDDVMCTNLLTGERYPYPPED